MDIIIKSIIESSKQGIAPAIVLLIYLIFVKIIDAKRDSKQIKLNDSLINSVNNINDFVVDITENIIDKNKEKCKKSIENSFNANYGNICKACISIIINNNIQINKENIIKNINDIINTEFYKTYNTLSLYKVNGKRVKEYMKIEWKNEIIESIIDIIFNPNNDKLLRINYICNNLYIKFGNYQTYVMNNIN